MSRASNLLQWFVEQDNDMLDTPDDEIPPQGIKVKDYIKREKKLAKQRGEVVDDDPKVIDADDDDETKAKKVNHHIDRTSGLTKDNEIKNYAFPVKRVKKSDE